MFVTATEIRERTSFEELSSLSDSDLDWYIERADSWIYRATGRDYTAETRESIQRDLRIATILLVELLWLKDQPDIKESEMSGLSSERIGSYSYNVKAQPGECTGNAELDSILESLKGKNYVNFFGVFGPSRAKGDGSEV